MPLSKEQLMIPRVLCIGGKEGEKHYPDSKTKTGEIYEVLHDRDLKEYEKYPHLFKLLPWWYGRTVEEMPLFVKCIKTPDQVHFPDEVFKVNWKLSHLGFSDRGGIVPNTDCYQPAGLSDYQEYQKQKEV